MSLLLQGAGLLARPSPGMARHAVEAGLVALLAVQAARLVWAAAAPLGPIGTPAPAPPPAARSDLTVLARFDPFGRGGPAVVADTPAPSAAALRLYGVRAGGGGPASAIIAGPDGRQAVYAIGETVAPGVVLQAVAADHVVLTADGRRSSLAFQRPVAGAAPAASAAYTPPSPPLPTPAPAAVARAEDMMLQNSLSPRVENGRVNGFSIQGGGRGAEVMQAAGLAPGDVLLSVNGAPLSNPEQAAGLAAQLADAGGATVQYERGGQVRTATVKMGRP